MPRLTVGIAGGSVVVITVVVVVVVVFGGVVVGFFEVDVGTVAVSVGPSKAAAEADGVCPDAVVRGFDAPKGTVGRLDEPEPLSSITETIPTTSTTSNAAPNRIAGRNRRGSSS